MKVGLEAFTIREISIDPFEQLEFAKDNGFEGLAFDELDNLCKRRKIGQPTPPDYIPQAGKTADIKLDSGLLKEIKAHSDNLSLYSNVSVTSCNPLFVGVHSQTVINSLRKQIEALADVGWHELRSTMGGVDERFAHSIPWESHIEASMGVLRALKPVLESCSSRINLEPHGDSTTFDLVRMIQDIGSNVLGVTLDTANVLVHAENPVEAVKRIAPYTHLTHAKDGIIYLTEKGFTRQGKPAGEGVVDWEQIIPILYKYSPDLPISIEDHKWLFEVQVFEKEWYKTHNELSAWELASVVKLARDTGIKIMQGNIMEPNKYEAIPFSEQIMDRLISSRDYLRRVVAVNQNSF